MSGLRTLAFHASVWTALGVLHGLQVRFGYLAAGAQITTPAYPVWMFVGWYVVRYWGWGLMTPLIGWLVHRFPPGRDWKSSMRAVAIYLAAAPFAVALHAALVAPILAMPFLDPDGDGIWRAWRFGVGVLTFFGLLTYGVITALLAVQTAQQRLREEERRTAAAHAQSVAARLRALQSQLHPHFLFNSLHAVGGLMLRDPERALEMIDRVGEFLRLSLGRSERLTAPLQDELEFIERYLAIELIRFGDRLQVRWEIDPATRDTEVPLLLLQPLVENAVRHGLAQRVAGGAIVLRAAFTPSPLRLQLEVEDDGPGFTPESAPGLGITNTRNRLASFYGDGASLKLEPGASAGVCARLLLPVTKASLGKGSTVPRESRMEARDPQLTTA